MPSLAVLPDECLWYNDGSMTPKLSRELRQALHDNADRPIEVVDPGTNKVYVLVSADMFQRVKPLIDEEDFDIRETYAAQFAAMNTPECWGAPGMEAYDNDDAHKPTS
jgi:hypothetical protein